MMGKMLDALTAPEGDTSKPNHVSVTVNSTEGNSPYKETFLMWNTDHIQKSIYA